MAVKLTEAVGLAYERHLESKAVTVVGKTCIVCRRLLTPETDSREHVIPASIGGRKTVQGFICKSCNNMAGATWDRTVSEQLHAVGLLVGTTRQDGELPPITVETTGAGTVRYGPGGSVALPGPKVIRESTGTTERIAITARSREELRTIVEGLAKKNQNLDVGAVLATATDREISVGTAKFSMPEGGPDYWRSGVKSMLAIMSASGQDPALCREATEFLTGQTDEPCIGYYYDTDLVRDRPDRVPMHLVTVTGSNAQGIVAGYIEYYGIFRAVSLLSSSYSGPAFSATYALDPRTGTSLAASANLVMTKAEILACYEYTQKMLDGMRAAYEDVLGSTIKKANADARSQLIDKAMLESMAACGIEPGSVASEQQTEQFLRDVSKRVVDGLLRSGQFDHPDKRRASPPDGSLK